MKEMVLPDRWRSVRLGHVAGTHVPQRDKPETLDGPIPWIRIEDFSGQEIRTSKSGQGVTAEQVAAMNLRVYEPGTVLCSCSCTMGATAIVREPLVSNQTFIGLTPQAPLDSRYLYYLMFSMRDELQATATGAIQQYLSRDDFRSLRIPLPPLEEQRLIGTYLDVEIARIDRLQLSTRRQIALMIERRGVAFHQALEIEGGPRLGTLDPCSDSDHWSMVPLNQALKQLTNGYVGATREIFVDHGVPYLQSLHIKDGRVDFQRRPYFVTEAWARERPRIRLGIGDVLIVQTGAIGEVAIVDELSAGASCHALLIARANRAILEPTYLWHALRSYWGKNTLLREQTGALHPHLEAGNVRFIALPIADLNRQRRVVDRVEEIVRDMKRVERLLAQRLNLQKERRQALITAAITGQFDVSSASGRGIEG